MSGSCVTSQTVTYVNKTRTREVHTESVPTTLRATGVDTPLVTWEELDDVTVDTILTKGLGSGPCYLTRKEAGGFSDVCLEPTSGLMHDYFRLTHTKRKVDSALGGFPSGSRCKCEYGGVDSDLPPTEHNHLLTDSLTVCQSETLVEVLYKPLFPSKGRIYNRHRKFVRVEGR